MSKSTTVETAPTMPEDDKYKAEADFLSRVLAHPDVPIDYTNYLAGVIIDIQGDVTLTTPEVFRVAWPLIRQQSGNDGNALWVAISEAFRTFGDDETQELVEKLRLDAGKRTGVKTAAPSDLAELISTVLRHPETPASVRESILQGMCQYPSDDTAPEHIRLVLEGHRAEKGGKEE